MKEGRGESLGMIRSEESTEKICNRKNISHFVGLEVTVSVMDSGGSLTHVFEKSPKVVRKLKTTCPSIIDFRRRPPFSLISGATLLTRELERMNRASKGEKENRVWHT